MTPIGINNGNFRNGDYREWASQDLSGVPTWDQLMELKKLETAYGADWEHDADALRQLLESGEDAHPAEVAYELEKAMDADDPRTEWERNWDDYCAEVEETKRDLGEWARGR